MNGNSEVTGEYFGSSNWKTICLDTYNKLCDPNQINENKTLHRCPNKDYCTTDPSGWPSRVDIDLAMTFDSFSDPEKSNKYAKDSFGNFVEGFVLSESCGNGSLCSCDQRSCEKFVRKLHNSVSA